MKGFVEYPEVEFVGMNHELRAGNFTSSKIGNLMTNGKAKGSYGAPFYSYVEEKKMERRLGRMLTDEVNAKPLLWGSLLESMVFRLLGNEYQPCSKTTLEHPTVKSWKGSPDATKTETVGEVKCPYTLKSFCLLIDSWAKGGIAAVRDNHKDGDMFYWQMVSNAILTKSKYAELIVYVPYKSELDAVRELAQNFDGGNQHKLFWIAMADDLPFLIDGGHYKNLNVMRFEVPVADKIALHARVEAATELLTLA